MTLVITAMSNPCFSQFTSKEDADRIANKYIQMITDEQGHWARGDSAFAEPAEELQNGDKIIGYYCNVRPSGFLVFSLRKELAPVKAWSDRNHFDPDAEEGIEAVIKSCMTRLIDTIESLHGPVSAAKSADIKDMAEIDYSPVWTSIENYIDGTLLQKTRTSGNYQEGDSLITSNWHQGPPFNNSCPNLGCSNTSNGNALVGCVATAGAQIMRYWGWPPDSYDWVNMPDEVTPTSPPAQQAAVAVLSHEIGVAVDMEYGCDKSGSFTSDMVGVFVNNYGYNSTCTVKNRDDYSAADWFDLLKFNLDRNRPTQYRVPGHSIVCDGWRLFGVNQTKQYHMNYGWSGTSGDTWYTLDALPGSNPGEEYIIHRTFPGPSLGWNLSGYYSPTPSPWRYFDQDAAGENATFDSGHKLQTLPGIKIIGSGTSTYVKFFGTVQNPTLIFTRGDQHRGIDIQNGGIKLIRNGAIRLD